MLNEKRHSGESRNPVRSRPSGCRIKSGMTENAVYGQTLIKESMKLFSLKTFIIFLSFPILGACAVSHELQKSDKGSFSLQPVQATTQTKSPIPKPLAYYHFLLSQL